MYSWEGVLPWALILVGTLVSCLFGFPDLSVKKGKKKKRKIEHDSLIDVYL